MRNHILYLKPFIELKISDKEGAAVDTVFVYHRFAFQTSKISKILSFIHRATETSRLTWRNPFEHRSTQSAISDQFDQNAPS